MTSEVGAGAAVEAWRATALIVKAGRNAHLGAAIMASATVAGVTARAGRTEANHCMLGVSTITVR